MKLRFLACVTLASLAAPASAHAFLDHANPGADATLHAAPRNVMLVFSDDLDPESSVQIVDASGHSVATGRTMITGKCIMAPLRPLGPGKYRVMWHAVSMDDHRTQGAYEFNVQR
ncbi:MAG: copper resistance CopC family protein [Myxococcales bacterium]